MLRDGRELDGGDRHTGVTKGGGDRAPAVSHGVLALLFQFVVYDGLPVGDGRHGLVHDGLKAVFPDGAVPPDGGRGQDRLVLGDIVVNELAGCFIYLPDLPRAGAVLRLDELGGLDALFARRARHGDADSAQPQADEP